MAHETCTIQSKKDSDEKKGIFFVMLGGTTDLAINAKPRLDRSSIEKRKKMSKDTIFIVAYQKDEASWYLWVASYPSYTVLEGRAEAEQTSYLPFCRRLTGTLEYPSRVNI